MTVKRDFLFVGCEAGHDWRFYGGANCGCEWTGEDGGQIFGSCSVPIHRCSRCGDYDYGDNAEAVQVVADCAAERGEAQAA